MRPVRICPSSPRPIRWFAWEPGTDTAVAALTAVLWTGAYYLLTHPSGRFSWAFDTAALLAAVIFPLWYVCLHRRLPPREIGITRERWKESLLVSGIVAIPFLWLVFSQYSQAFGTAALIPHLAVNALVLWEPFFVYCWLLLRFDRAFGIVPGILLAGICFGAYHLGTYPLPGVLVLVLYGWLFGAIFRVTESLLILWPLAWMASSAKGTLAGGMVFSWNDIGSSALILVVQLAFLAWTWKANRKQVPDRQSRE